MTRIKLVGLCLIAVFAFGAVAVSQASAAEYIYKVGGTKLEGNKEIRSSAKKEFVLRGKGTFEAEAVTKCKALKLNEGEKPVIVGGKPGRSEKELVEFNECSATIAGAKCSSVTVSNVPTKNEIVTVAAPTSLKGRLASLFTPATGTEFSKVAFTKCGILGNQSATVTGNAAALDEPEKVEGKVGVLNYPAASSAITEVETSSGGKIKVKLESNSKTASIEGEANVELVGGENWGVF